VLVDSDAPRWPISSPAPWPARFRRTPRARITTSAGYSLPDSVRTFSDPFSPGSNPATPSLSAGADHGARGSLRDASISGSIAPDLAAHLDQRHVEAAVNEVLRGFQTDEAAAHTTARVFGARSESRIWFMPARKAEPRSIHSRIARASGTVLTSKMPGRSIPAAAVGSTARGRQHQFVVGLVLTSPVATFRSSTVLRCGEMPIASQRV